MLGIIDFMFQERVLTNMNKRRIILCVVIFIIVVAFIIFAVMSKQNSINAGTENIKIAQTEVSIRKYS
jgi:uncharacterized membrane protein (DUF4010 family)